MASKSLHSTEPEENISLPYDDVPMESSEPKSGGSLLGRIGKARVYVPDETSASMFKRLAKRKRDVLEDPPEQEESVEVTMIADPSLRDNAILLTGTPIEHLPTAKIFAYAAFYAKTPPMALEWISDTLVIIVYESAKDACVAYRKLMKEPGDIPDTAVERLAHPVPAQLWPAQMRVNTLLAEGEGLGGDIQIRWASTSDVKQKGAANQSKFYKTYGEQAGKDGRPAWENASKKRRFPEGSWKNDQREALDRDLDRSPRDNERYRSDRGDRRRPQGDSGRPSHRGVTKDDLDAELDAFVNERPAAE